jgi:hypothetical protein
MSAIATGDGTDVPVLAGQLTIPPMITTSRNTSETTPIRAARPPCRATGLRTATEPVVMTRRSYQRFTGNTVISP